LKKLAFLGGVLGLGIAALLVSQSSSHAADHIDAPAATASPMADIADVFAWMTADKSKVNLVMTISPADDKSRHFSPSILYVFHVTAVPGFAVPPMAGTETKVICKFASDTSAQCWVGATGFVSGDPSNMAGLTNKDGSIRVFAGRRSDPFFFNLQGFRNTVALVEAAAGANKVTVNAAGCPSGANGLTNEQLGGLLQGCLFGDPNLGATTQAKCGFPLVTTVPAMADPPCSQTSSDCFASLDVIAIVLQVNTSLLANSTNPVIGVWGSTHASM
jgi:hypothetical protein